MNTHIMLDIETLGTGSNSLVLGIGAVEFSLSGATFRQFSINLPVLEQILNPNVQVDVDTISWWKLQSNEAKLSLLKKKPAKTVKEGLEAFSKFLTSFEEPPSLWGNGCTFDNAIIRNLYKAFGISFPLPFYADKDVRTIVDLIDYKKVKDKVAFTGTKHNAIDDCLYQVKLVAEGLKLLKESK
jgi:exodeoxyribonuclease VIII